MPERAGTAAARAAAAVAEGASPPPLPTGRVLAANRCPRQRGPAVHSRFAPTRGFENALPAPVPDGSRCTKVCRATRAQRGVGRQEPVRLVTAVAVVPDVPGGTSKANVWSTRRPFP